MPRQPVEDAARFVPGDASLEALRQAAQACTACPLYAHAAGPLDRALGEAGLGAIARKLRAGFLRLS